MITLEQKTSEEISRAFAARLAAIRKKQHYTQQSLALKSGVSLGSLKRFEQTGEISFVSLVKIAIALGLEGEIDNLFKIGIPTSIKEVIELQE